MPVIDILKTNLTVPNDPNDPVTHGFVDLALELSKYYGKNIRQGHTFMVSGVQTSIRPSDGLTDDWDVGASCITTFEYQPTTKLPRLAWNKTFKQWVAQKRLSQSGLQGNVKYDDFELNWNSSSAYLNGRASQIRSAGLTDTTTERVMMVGSSTEGSDFTLQDLVNSTMDAPTKSADPFDNVTYKDAKFSTTHRWPDSASFQSAATASNHVFNGGAGDRFVGSMSTADLVQFPTALPVMCGLLPYKVHIPVDDTLTAWADTFDLCIQLFVKSWKPLVYKPKPKNKKTSSKKYRRRYVRGPRYARKRSRR